jgi:hypothetical protein
MVCLPPTVYLGESRTQDPLPASHPEKAHKLFHAMIPNYLEFVVLFGLISISGPATSFSNIFNNRAIECG